MGIPYSRTRCYWRIGRARFGDKNGFMFGRVKMFTISLRTRQDETLFQHHEKSEETMLRYMQTFGGVKVIRCQRNRVSYQMRCNWMLPSRLGTVTSRDNNSILSHGNLH